MSKSVLFLHKYSSQIASYRYRFAQYFPLLESNGYKVTSYSLIPDRSMRQRMSGQSTSFTELAKIYWQRIKQLLLANQYDIVVVYFEALPYLPFQLESLLLPKKTKLVLDFDDAIFYQYQESSNPLVRFLLKSKIENLAQQADLIIVGNDFLYQHFKNHNPNTKIIPTVIDLNNYAGIKTYATPPKLGWLGSPSTSRYLLKIQPAIEKYCEMTGTLAVIIGADRNLLKHKCYHHLNWSEDTEVENIRKFDIGLMPLDDSKWSKGKCGFKLIQYMACHLPTVASPVGANTHIVHHGESGFLAESLADWSEAFTKLRDHHTAQKFGHRGRKIVEDHYSLQAVSDSYLSHFENLL